MEYRCLILLALVFIRFKGSDTLCTFPENLNGNWISAEKGILNFTNNAIVNYPVSLSAIVNSTTYICEEQDGDTYFLRGTSFRFGSDYLRPHLCIEIHRVSDDVMYYYLATEIEPTNNERVYVRKADVNVTMEEACDRVKPFEVSTFVVLIKEGANMSSASRTCPTTFLKTFENVTILSHDNSSRCDSTQADVCTNTSIIQYMYNDCPTSLTFSRNGSKHCIFDISDGQTTYLAVWNNDHTVDNSNTHRLTCYAFADTDPLYATEYPGSCQATQTPTSVVANGVQLIYNDVSENCAPGQATPEPTSIPTIVSGAAGGNEELLLSTATISVIIVACLILLCSCLLCLCACKRWKKNKKKKSSEQLLYPNRDAMNNGPPKPGNGRVWIEDLDDDNVSPVYTVPSMVTGQSPNGAVSPYNNRGIISSASKPQTKRPSLDSGRHSMSMEVEESPNITKSVATAPPISSVMIAQNKPVVVKDTSMSSKYATIKLGGVKESKDLTTNSFMETEMDGKPVTAFRNKRFDNSRSEDKLGNTTVVNEQVKRQGDTLKINSEGNSSNSDVMLNSDNLTSHRVHFGTNDIKIISPSAPKSKDFDGYTLTRNGSDDEKYERNNRPYKMKPDNRKLVSGTSTQTDISMGDLQTDDWKAERGEGGVSSYVSPTYRFTYPNYHANTHSVPYWELLRNLTQNRAGSRTGRSLWDAVHKPTRINPMPWRYWK